MAAECSQQAVLDFLKEKGGKVKNADLIEHFKAVFPEEKAEKAAVRKSFKNYVDDIAFVKTESGVKYVCLRKKLRGSVKEEFNGTETLAVLAHLGSDGSDACAVGGPVSGYGSDTRVTLPHVLNSTTNVLTGQISVVGEVDGCSGDMGNRASFKRDRSESRKKQTGNTPGDIPEITVIEASSLPAEGSMFAMPGPAHSVPDGPLETKSLSVDGSKEDSPRDGPVESLSVDGFRETSPRDGPVESLSVDGFRETSPRDGPVESLSVDGFRETSPRDGPVESLSVDGFRETSPRDGPVESLSVDGSKEASLRDRPVESLSVDGFKETSPRDGPVKSLSVDDFKEPSPRDGPIESLSVERTNVVIRRRDSKGSQRRYPESGDGEVQADMSSLSGSEGPCSPKGSREHFIEVMMNSSPQVRRSLVLRHSVHLSSRADSDSVSLVSSNADEDRLALDPLEHEWMMCASDGEWGSLCLLLAAEPGLVLRKDFVTGFTCLHWAAKQGKPELMALIINFAKQHDVPISVDVRSNTGYTPLHVAAMHGHMEVVKLLVGAYNADVEVRDYSGRKACQYLTDNASVDIQDIIGAYERSDAKDAHRRDGGRWRFSKVLQSNLKPLRLVNSAGTVDSVDKEARPRDKVLRRKSSLGRMKPKLQKLRLRTSQIVHSTTFRDTEEANASFESRPKTHFFR